MIPVRYERRRGCGFRKVGGLYIVGEPPSLGGLTMLAQSAEFTCNRLPLPLHDCVHCGRDLNPVRGWTWVRPAPFLVEYGQELPLDCRAEGTASSCSTCPLGWQRATRCGLMWIGAEFYTPASFLYEALERGISRRIARIPQGFESGRTWVLFAHRYGITDQGRLWADGFPGDQPAVVAIARAHLEMVVPRLTSDIEAEGIRARGIEPVIVVPVGDDGLQVPAGSIDGEDA